MQAVILAAGHGTRMDELTTAVPKPMLLLNGKPLLQYKFDVLGPEFDEIIIVIGYEGAEIKNRFGGSYEGKRLHYVEQTEHNGTAGALWCAKDLLKNRFLVMTGDDVYGKNDVAACVGSPDWALLVQPLLEMHRAGWVEIGESGTIETIIEGDRDREAGIASTNLFSLDTRIFLEPLIPKQAGSEEFGLPQTVSVAARALGVPLHPIYTNSWIQINSPKDLTEAERTLKSQYPER